MSPTIRIKRNQIHIGFDVLSKLVHKLFKTGSKASKNYCISYSNKEVTRLVLLSICRPRGIIMKALTDLPGYEKHHVNHLVELLSWSQNVRANSPTHQFELPELLLFSDSEHICSYYLFFEKGAFSDDQKYAYST